MLKFEYPQLRLRLRLVFKDVLYIPCSYIACMFFLTLAVRFGDVKCLVWSFFSVGSGACFSW
jgi:hypothetical protein